MSVNEDTMSTPTTGAYVDQTTHKLLLRELNENKKYKEKIMREIIAAVCAMLNTNGGIVAINIDADGNGISVSQMSSVVRIVEQHLITIIGTNIASYINFEEDKETVIISVKKADTLITVAYNLFLPIQTQVIQVPPSELQEKVKNDILNRNAVRERVQLESHEKTFFKSKECGLSETKTVQLKNLKAGASKCTTLVDRIIGKSNKFKHYVSAFANYNGGHIYYGIDDDGIVAGELIEDEMDKSEIIKKVEKSINKMIWPEQPKRKEHWEISFEPVLDDNSPIPSTFVIVIYICPCLGGVFTEDPECYEMVKGKVEKMSFTTWKKKIMQPSLPVPDSTCVVSLPVPNSTCEVFLPVPDLTMKRATWGSPRIQRICNKADETLLPIINNGKSIEAISNILIKKHPDVPELKLIILAKEVMASNRSCIFEAARKVLNKYRRSLTTATESWMFYALDVYLETAIYSTEGDVEAVNKIMSQVLNQAEIITPGRISAALYLLAALNLLQQKGDNDNSPALFATKALQHLKHVQDLPTVRGDMEQKAHIVLAMFYLGCNRLGVPTRGEIDSTCLKKAESSIMEVHQSTYKGHRINPYRKCQFNFVQSILLYRKSQVQPDDKKLLDLAFETFNKAQTRATAYNFQDIKNWCRECTALFTDNQVGTHIQTRGS